ncbi:MAG: hypothetical protein ACKOX3_09440 [Bacteroidota bacterium]
MLLAINANKVLKSFRLFFFLTNIERSTMEIKTNYYYRNKDGVLKQGGTIVFNRYRIISAEGRDLPANGVVFYSSRVDDMLKVEANDAKMISVPINRIITEKEYTANQMEYYIWLNWINQQRFKWINKRHILQQKKTLLHLGLYLLLIYFVYQLFQILID